MVSGGPERGSLEVFRACMCKLIDRGKQLQHARRSGRGRRMMVGGFDRIHVLIDTEGREPGYSHTLDALGEVGGLCLIEF